MFIGSEVQVCMSPIVMVAVERERATLEVRSMTKTRCVDQAWGYEDLLVMVSSIPEMFVTRWP